LELCCSLAREMLCSIGLMESALAALPIVVLHCPLLWRAARLCGLLSELHAACWDALCSALWHDK